MTCCFKASVSLLVFCLDDPSIDVSGVLKFPSVITLLSVSLLMFVLCVCAPVLGAYIFTVIIFLLLAVSCSLWDPYQRLNLGFSSENPMN